MKLANNVIREQDFTFMQTDLSLTFAHFLGNNPIDGEGSEEEEYSNERYPADVE